MRRQPGKPGLQAERTLLSWERSAFGFLVCGVFVLARPHGPLGPGRVVLALIAAALALLVLGLGHRRARQHKNGRVVAGISVVPAPHLQVWLLGVATVGFALLVVGALVYSAALG